MSKCVLFDRECISCDMCNKCEFDENKICDNCMKCLNLEQEYAEIKIDEIILNENN